MKNAMKKLLLELNKDLEWEYSAAIQGERKQEKEEKGKKFHRVECSYGSFVRSFRVPDDADENKIKAEFKDGMLNVTLPKSEKKAKAKSINVPLA